MTCMAWGLCICSLSSFLISVTDLFLFRAVREEQIRLFQDKSGSSVLQTQSTWLLQDRVTECKALCSLQLAIKLQCQCHKHKEFPTSEPLQSQRSVCIQFSPAASQNTTLKVHASTHATPLTNSSWSDSSKGRKADKVYFPELNTKVI